MSRFADRLISGTYAEDEPIHAFVPATGVEAWIPETLFGRLQALGRAYGLHVVSLLGEDALCFLNHAQGQSLAEELAFVAEVTNDAALHEQLSAIARVLSDGLAQADKTTVAFDWP